MERPELPKIETPAARHFEHTKREWTEHPERAPGWALMGNERATGAANWVACPVCEVYVEHTYRPALAKYDAEMALFRDWESRQAALREELAEEATLVSGSADLQQMLLQYQERTRQ